MTTITTDPVEQLSAVISRLSNLSTYPDLSDTQLRQILDQMHNLSGDLIKLATQQLQATDAQYNDYMTSVAAVTKALDTAETVWIQYSVEQACAKGAAFGGKTARAGNSSTRASVRFNGA